MIENMGKQSEIKSIDIEAKVDDGEPPKSSVFMGIANLVNFTIGAGVIGLPNTLCKVGTALGFPILLLTGIVVTWGARVVVKVKESTGLTSMVDMAERLLGAPGFWFLSLAEWLFLLSCMITYTVMVAQFTFPLLRYVDETTSFATPTSNYYRIFVAAMFVIILPTLLLKDLGVLGKISTIASFSILLLAIMTSTAVITTNVDKTPVNNHWPNPNFNFFDILGSMGCVLFAAFNVPAIPDIHKSLKNPTKINRVAILGNLVCIIFYLWVAVPVYVFTGNRQCSCKEVLVSGENKRPIDTLYTELFSRKQDGSTSLVMIVIASLGVAINVLCSIPLFHFILRSRSYKLYCRIYDKKDSERMPNLFFLMHSLVYLVVVGIAIGMPDVLFFLDFVGSIAGSSFLLIIPALLAMANENGGIAHNLSYTFAKTIERSNFAYMCTLNAILYFGGMIFLNSFYILVSAIMKKASA